MRGGSRSAFHSSLKSRHGLQVSSGWMRTRFARTAGQENMKRWRPSERTMFVGLTLVTCWMDPWKSISGTKARSWSKVSTSIMTPMRYFSFALPRSSHCVDRRFVSSGHGMKLTPHS